MGIEITADSYIEPPEDEADYYKNFEIKEVGNDVEKKEIPLQPLSSDIKTYVIEESIDLPTDKTDILARETEDYSSTMIQAMQGIEPVNDNETNSTELEKVDPNLNTRDGNPLPKVVDTPHVIEHYEGSINLEDETQESGETRLPPEVLENKEGKPGSLNWMPHGGNESRR